MKILSLELNNFRNFGQQSVLFNNDRIFFIGKNAQGKTNLLEAIYLLCLTKSFRTRHEKEAISFGLEQFILKGEFEFENSANKKVVLTCSQKEGKQLSVNRKRINRIADFIGELPIVISSPDEYEITIGPPPERRKLFDILISQTDRKYLHFLLEYHRIVRQKSAILQNWKQGAKIDKKALEPWNEQLVVIGSEIIHRRSRFCHELSQLLSQIYASLTLSGEKLEISYQPNLAFSNLDAIQNFFRNSLSQIMSREIQRGICLLGPHRDDFIFKINDKELKKFGSRGQHKTVLISLALAEYELIYALNKEKPIILIDDLFSELDTEREKLILEQLSNKGQVFLTGTEMRTDIKDDKAQFFTIEKGKIFS